MKNVSYIVIALCSRSFGKFIYQRCDGANNLRWLGYLQLGQQHRN